MILSTYIQFFPIKHKIFRFNVIQMTYPVSLHDRKYLIITSFLFFIPALRALYFQVPLLGTMSFLTGCASLNFWAFGLNNWRLTLDKTVAYSTTFCYYLTVFSHVSTKVSLLMAYLLITLCVAQSFSKAWEKWNDVPLGLYITCFFLSLEIF